ncbi:thioesterase domain-containing protein [Streptomyces sp. NBC_01335]|uniref:thioesterase domain-containing protein n=1 Tax=Streptomyces sp. NBC_01335 TaxID=2903828 RepID=UPI002E102BAA|nr:thioesterase domain-containing protein [Streptomyces sp. NBC_01335]
MRRPRKPEQPLVHRLKAAAEDRHTVYLVHPGALDASVHRSLADALPDGIGLTVLDLGGVAEYWQAALTGGHADTTLDALAARLMTAVGIGSGDGPYLLAGWSFGGVVAHAMTALAAPRRRPSRLVLLDSIAPVDAYKHDDDALEPSLLLNWFAMYLGAKRGRLVPVEEEQLAGLGTEDGLKVVLEAAIAAEVLLPSTPLPGLRKLYDTYVDGLLRNNRLTLPHRPTPSPVPVVLVRADRGLVPGDRGMGWESLAPHGLDVRECPGDHYTMLLRSDAATTVASLLTEP